MYIACIKETQWITKNDDVATDKKVGDNGGVHLQFWRNYFELHFELK